MLPVVVQVQAPDGTHVQVSGEGALSYPRNGRFVRAQSVTVEGDQLDLHRTFATRRARDGRPARHPGERVRRRFAVGPQDRGTEAAGPPEPGDPAEGRRLRRLAAGVARRAAAEAGRALRPPRREDGQASGRHGDPRRRARRGRCRAPATPTRLRASPARSSAARSFRARRTALSSRRTTSPPTTPWTSPFPSGLRSMRSRTA